MLQLDPEMLYVRLTKLQYFGEIATANIKFYSNGNYISKFFIITFENCAFTMINVCITLLICLNIRHGEFYLELNYSVRFHNNFDFVWIEQGIQL